MKKKPCRICGKSYSIADLKKHEERHRENSYQCQYCTVNVKLKSNLYKHIREVHQGKLYKRKKSEERFMCDLCPKSYHSSRALERHKTFIHKGIKSFKCDLCDKSYSDNTPLRIHKETTHSEEGSFNCKECHKSFTHNHKLKQHMKRAHILTKNVKCDYCDKMFHKYSIKEHIQFHFDLDSGKYRCDKCGINCGKNSLLRKHMLTHQVTEKLFKCDQCDKSYKAKHGLHLHKKYIHEKSEAGKWICKICSKEFAQSGSLYIHENGHRGERVQCLACDKTYGHKSTLKKHMAIHTGELQECPICKKKLSIYHSLELHMRTHTGEKPFKCKYCEKVFAAKKYLTNHTNRNHYHLQEVINERHLY